MVANKPFSVKIKEQAITQITIGSLWHMIADEAIPWQYFNILKLSKEEHIYKYIYIYFIYSFVTWAGLANFTVNGDKKKTFVIITLPAQFLSGFSNYTHAIKHQWGKDPSGEWGTLFIWNIIFSSTQADVSQHLIFYNNYFVRTKYCAKWMFRKNEEPQAL